MCSSISSAICCVCKINLLCVSMIAEFFFILLLQEADKEFRSIAEISRRKLVRSIGVVALFLCCWHVQGENVKFLWNRRNKWNLLLIYHLSFQGFSLVISFFYSAGGTKARTCKIS